VERFYESEFDDTKTDAGRGASRLIPPEFCVVRWMQLGSAQSIAIRGSWFSFPMLSPLTSGRTAILRGVMPKLTMLDALWRGRRGLSRFTISAER
jgi:hypothetical protein